MTSKCTVWICSLVLALQFLPYQGLNTDLLMPLSLKINHNYSRAVCAFLANLRHKHFDIIVQGRENNLGLLRVVECFLHCVPSNSSFVHTITVNYLIDTKSANNIIFVDSYPSFLKVYPHLEMHGLQESGRYMIVLVSKPRPGCYKIMENIMKKMYEIHVVDLGFVIHSSKGTMDFYTFYPYSSNNCEKVVPQRFNRYKNGVFERNLQIPLKKCQNFNGCTIKVFAWMLKPFTIFEREATLQPKTLNFTGFEGELLKIIAKKLNFSIQIVTDYSYNWGNVEGNKFTGPYALLHRGYVDMLFGSFTYSPDRIRYFPYSNSHYMTHYVAILRRQSTADQLFSWVWEPFQIEIWLFILLTFAVIMISITSNQYRSLYFLYYFGQLVGVPLPNPPRMNKKRCIAAQVVCFSFFILRSVYMANIYYTFSNEHFITPPATITDLFNQNYKLLSTREFIDPNSGITVPKSVPEGSNGYMIYDMLEQYPIGSKTAALVSYAQMMYYKRKINPQMTFEPIRQPVKLHNFCAYFKWGSCLAKPFSFLVESLLNTGVVKKWVSEFSIDSVAYKNYYKKMTSVHQPMPLSLRKLSFVFMLLALGLFISFLVFIFELRRGRH